MFCLGQGLSQLLPPTGPCALLSADLSVLQTDFQMGKPRLKKGQGWHLNKRLCQSRVLGTKQKCRSVGASEWELYPCGGVSARTESEGSQKPGSQG